MTEHQLFLLINLGERAGSGLPKIRAGWEAERHVLRLTDTVEPFDQTVLEMDWAITAETPGKTPGKTLGKTPRANFGGATHHAPCINSRVSRST